MYLLRLDDASEYMDTSKWDLIEDELDNYNIKPIVGIIPYNQDQEFLCRYKVNEGFWDKVKRWQSKGWEIAMHGYNHVYSTSDGGLNPINLRSEFAGVPLNIQKEKIKLGMEIFKNHDIEPKIFFAPSHTFDINTIKAIKEESNIKIICDTIANDIYFKDGIYFIPQQCGQVRKLPFRVTTFCYHPNNMSELDFNKLRVFLTKKNNKYKFIQFAQLELNNRNINFYDKILKDIYFNMQKIR